MSTKDNLNLVISKWDLLQHPFYRAWSAGTLPLDALRSYASEYGAFIGLLPAGWKTLGDAETAHEEMEHAGLWDRFAAALQTRVTSHANIPQVESLIKATSNLFSDPAHAAGALYAFEVQQPATAESKLTGLRTHYQLPGDAQLYFDVHSHNQYEAQKLLQRIESLSADDQKLAVAACAAMSEALWNALSGIYKTDQMSD